MGGACERQRVYWRKSDVADQSSGSQHRWPWFKSHSTAYTLWDCRQNTLAQSPSPSFFFYRLEVIVPASQSCYEN